jgi:DNA-binding response OmpR family regulator
MARLVICDDETHITDILSRFFKDRGHEVFGTVRAEEALERVLSQRTDLVITDIAMKGISGLDLLKRIKAAGLDVPVIITTGNPSHNSAVTALREGAFDYLVKPFHLEEIAARAERGLAAKRVRDENVLYSKLVSLHSIAKAVAQAASPEELSAKVIRLGARLTQSDAGWFRAGGGSLSPKPDSPELEAFLLRIADVTIGDEMLAVNDSSESLQGEEAWFVSLPVTAGPVQGALIFRRWKPEGKYDAVDLEVFSQLAATFALGLRALGASAPRLQTPKPPNAAAKPRKARPKPKPGAGPA